MGHSDATDFFFHYQSQIGFSGQEFCNISAEGFEMKEADFFGIKICESTFLECDFSGSNFNAALLENVVFLDCKLDGCCFENIEGQSLSFVGCEMEEASFMNADIDGLELSSCCGSLDLMHAGLHGAHFIHAKMCKSDLRKADMTKAVFEDCDLSRSSVDEFTCLKDASLFRTNITDMRLAVAQCYEPDMLADCIVDPFSGPNLIGTQLMLPTHRGELTPAGKSSSTDLSIYRSVDLSARLYCADIEEFRRTQR